MDRRRLFCVVVLTFAAAVGQGQAKKNGPASAVTTGVVAGLVTCADTNAPARSAVVALERVPEQPSEAAAKNQEDSGINPTATTDMEGRFLLEKVAAGRYYVVARLTGYLNPLARFSEKQLRAPDDETRKELARTVVMVSVGANQAATANLRLEHASELNGTVLYDDGSPAVGLEVQLLRKDKDGSLSPLPPAAVNGMGLFGSIAETDTDDRGRYRVIGAPAGEYALRVILPAQKEGEGLSIYLGDTFRKKDARVVKIGEVEQSGGLDITIASDGLHSVRGTVVAKVDGHPVSRARVELLYADDRELIRTTEIGRDSDEGGSFEFSYVPAGQYILRLIDAIDTERLERYALNSNFTDEKLVHRYDVAEMPVIVQGDVSGVELAAPEVVAVKPPTP
jgi:hypothetical protein